jgi:hypothetical protein
LDVCLGAFSTRIFAALMFNCAGCEGRSTKMQDLTNESVDAGLLGY